MKVQRAYGKPRETLQASSHIRAADVPKRKIGMIARLDPLTSISHLPGLVAGAFVTGVALVLGNQHWTLAARQTCTAI